MRKRTNIEHLMNLATKHKVLEVSPDSSKIFVCIESDGEERWEFIPRRDAIDDLVENEDGQKELISALSKIGVAYVPLLKEKDYDVKR